MSHKKNFPESDFMDLDSVLVLKCAKKELGQYPAILTSHLVVFKLSTCMFDEPLMPQVNCPVFHTIHLLRSFPSIALRIPTAHNFTRD